MKLTERINLDSLASVSSLKNTNSDEIKARLKKATSRSSWINYIVIFFSIYFVWNTAIAIRHNQRLQLKLETLQNKAQLLEEANKNLALQKNYYVSKEYQEKALKDNFNLVSSGEKVLIIKDLPPAKDKSNNIFSELQELKKLINQ